MSERSQELASRFELVAKAFVELVQGLDEEQWHLTGKNHPTIRAGDEDEGRPVGVIAFHVAAAMQRQATWVPAIAQGKPFERPPQTNQQQAEEHRDVTQAEVVELLSSASAALRAVVAGFSDDELGRRGVIMVGEVTVAEAIEKVVIGHVLWHQGSIEATIAPTL